MTSAPFSDVELQHDPTVVDVGTRLPSSAMTVNRCPDSASDMPMLPLASSMAEQDPFFLPHANGLAVAQHPIAERCWRIHHLKAVVGRRPFVEVLHADPKTPRQ